jgi:SSS family solute:Na+ symporter
MLFFGLTVARRVKQLGDGDRHLTYPDFIERHYDNRTRAVATITTVLAYTAYSAGQFAAAAAILQVLVGWSYGQCLLLAGAIVTLYTAAGGYLAVTYTDRVQVTLVILGIVAVGVPVAISQAGSWADMRAVLPPSHYDFGAQGWDHVAALVVSMVLSFFVAMDSFSRSFAARDAKRRGAAHCCAAPDAADRASGRLARPRRGRALSRPGIERQHPRDFRPRSLPGGASRD